MPSPRRIVLLGFDRAQSLDLVGPLEVFATADRLSPGRYATEVVAPGGRPFATGSGLRITPDRSPAGCRGAIDTLIVAGGLGVHEAARDEGLVRWVGSAAQRSRRLASVCTGAFVLARAGLLDGRRATTHWASAGLLAERHPEIDVDPDPIFVRDTHGGTGRDVWTSAGVTAGMDLALAMVEDDYGREAALEVARWLVVFVKRPGGQAQFSEPLAAQTAEREPLREVQDLVRSDPAAALTVEEMAAHAAMSPRNFARSFRREVGVTPGAYVELVRVERARQMLETTELGTDAVGAACGFGRPETFRRAFGRRLGVSPGQYRDRFRAALPEAA